MEFVNVKLTHSNHKVGINFWHMEFTTKYRYKVFGKFKYKSLIEACIQRVAHKHNINIHILRVMPEHIHMMATLPKGMNDEKAFQLLKGASSYYFFKNHPKARLRYPKGHLWSRGKFISSVGFVQLDVVNKYIKGQAKHHNTVFVE